MITRSFPLRVLAITFIFLALPLLILSFIFFQISYEDSIEDAKRDLKEVANYRASAILGLEPVKQVLLKEIMEILDLPGEIKTMPNKEMDAHLKEIGMIQEGFDITVLSLGEGSKYKVLGSSISGQVGKSFTSFVQLEKGVKEGTGDFFRYIYSEEQKKDIPYIFVTRTITEKQDSKPLGILMLSAPIDNEIDALLAKGGEARDISFALLNIDGIVFAATDPKLILNYFRPISSVRKQQIVQSGQLGSLSLPSEGVSVIAENGTPFFEFVFNGKSQLAYRASIPQIGLSFIAYSTKEAIFGASLRRFIFIYVSYGLILVVGVGVTYALSVWMARPFNQLSSMMKKVSKGDLTDRFKEERFGFEINALGGIFNHTLETLLKHIKKAEDEKVLKETLIRELKIGQEVQKNLFPKTKESLVGVELADVYLPAEEVGGDFYDVFVKKDSQGDESILLTIADAAGKGVSPCLYALGLRSQLRAVATFSDDVGEILSETNNFFIQDTGDSGMFVTVLSGMYNPKTHEFSYYSFGHVPGFVRKKNGEIITLSHTGMAMGLLECGSIKPAHLTLEPGDLVFFYTDGIVDATNDHYQNFSQNRIIENLRQKKWITAQEVADGMVSEVQKFTGSMPQTGDITLLIMRITP